MADPEGHMDRRRYVGCHLAALGHAYLCDGGQAFPGGSRYEGLSILEGKSRESRGHRKSMTAHGRLGL